MSAKSNRERQLSSHRRAQPNPTSGTVRRSFKRVHDCSETEMQTWRVKVLYTSKQAMPPMHAQAGIGSTKKSRNRARGAAKAKKDAKAYIAPARCNVTKKRHLVARWLTACTVRMIVGVLVPHQRHKACKRATWCSLNCGVKTEKENTHFQDKARGTACFRVQGAQSGPRTRT